LKIAPLAHKRFVPRHDWLFYAVAIRYGPAHKTYRSINLPFFFYASLETVQSMLTSISQIPIMRRMIGGKPLLDVKQMVNANRTLT